MIRRLWKPVKHWVLLGILAGLEWGFWLLPLAAARSMGAWLGRVFYALVPYERKKTLASVATAFPEMDAAAVRRVAKGVFSHLGRGGAEFLRFRFLSLEQVTGWVAEVEGQEHIFGPFQRGQGVVAVTGHYGNWELLAAWTALHGRVAVVGRQLYDPRVDEALTRRRQAKGLTLFQRNTAVRPILRWLKDGGILGVLADQDTGVDSMYVDFFGREAKTPSGPAVLAAATGSALVTAYCRRRPDGAYKLVYQPAIPVPPRREGGSPMDLWPVVQEYARRMEAAIREAPEQWAFNHSRWRSPIQQASNGWDPKWAEACLERIQAYRKAGS